MQRLRFRLVTVIGVLAAALCIAVSSSAAATGKSHDPPGSGIGSLDWGTCSDPGLAGIGAQCADLSVPVDYSRPNGPKIELAVSRFAHTSSAADYKGAILINPEVRAARAWSSAQSSR